MKLSDTTLATLKNFAMINDSLYINPGKRQKSLNIDETIMVDAVLDDEFETGFGIYDLPQFLASVTALNNPELTFNPTFLTISDNNISLDYFYCSPTLIKSPPTDKEMDIGDADVEFSLEQASFQKLLKVASLNALPILSIVGKNGTLGLKTHESSSDTSNVANMKLGEYEGKDFSASFQITNLKMIPDDYTVKVNLAGFALFENKAGTLKYFVALEK